MLSNDNAFLNTYPSHQVLTKDKSITNKTKNGTDFWAKQVNPFDQRTLFARFKINSNDTSGMKINKLVLKFIVQ